MSPLAILRSLKQIICRHQWQATRFQALSLDTSQECTKCGKYRRVFLRSIAAAEEKHRP